MGQGLLKKTFMNQKPLMIDLYCGLGGWASGGIAEGYDVIGFDIERHQYWMPEVDATPDGGKGTRPVEKRGWTQGCAVSLGMEGALAKPRTRLVEYPAQLVLQDILTIHGKQFKDAALIVASPPCQEYSYMAMPWSRGKAIAAEYRSGARDVKQLTALFDACFRIQREAIEAAGHFIPLVVENVRGAIPWVGRSRWNFGSFHLWGDVPALMPMTHKGIPHKPAGHWTNPEENGTKGMGCGSVSWHQGKGQRHPNDPRNFRSKSSARKAASAAIAKIPFELSRHIARVYKPTQPLRSSSGCRTMAYCRVRSS